MATSSAPHASLASSALDAEPISSRTAISACHLYGREFTLLQEPDGRRFLIGVQIAALLQRETFNLYRSLKLLGIECLRLSPEQVELLSQFDAVRKGIHSVTLIPYDGAVMFMDRELNKKPRKKASRVGPGGTESAESSSSSSDSSSSPRASKRASKRKLSFSISSSGSSSGNDSSDNEREHDLELELNTFLDEQPLPKRFVHDSWNELLSVVAHELRTVHVS